MRVLLDACILFPTIMREILIETASAGGFVPLWSDKITAEWQHTAKRFGDVAGEIAKGEILTLNTQWPDAAVSFPDTAIDQLSLPDENDLHVLAAAIAGKANILLTKNLRDFPPRTLARHGIILQEPDLFLTEFAHGSSVDMAAIVENVRRRTERISGREQPLRPLLKRARLPRLGKLLG